MDLRKIETLIVGNAAGTVRTVEQVRKLAGSAVTRITVGSITKLPRQGNIPIPGGNLYYYDEATGASVNALGIPNVGIEVFVETLDEMVHIARDAGKELWVSVAGFAPEEFVELARICFAYDVDGVELNLGCPNIHDGGASKPIYSYRPDMVTDVLDYMDAEFVGQKKQIGVKISPVPGDILTDLVHTINRSLVVTEVVAVNTIPDRELEDETGRSALAYIPPGGSEVKHTGGLAGTSLKAEGLRIARELRSHSEKAKATLISSTRLVVAGGIRAGADLKDYFDQTEEIDGFQCGTLYFETENVAVFSDIPAEFVNLLEPA